MPVPTPRWDASQSITDEFRAELKSSTSASRRATHTARARATSGRRRVVDPTTCKRDYFDAELESMQAMHDYKQRSGRMFPTWSEVLEVVNGLGYRRQL
jgi:hypothetical protein